MYQLSLSTKSINPASSYKIQSVYDKVNLKTKIVLNFVEHVIHIDFNLNQVILFELFDYA